MPTAPPVITTPPEAPSRAFAATFVTKADAWVAWLEAEANDVGSCATSAYQNATEALASANAAIAAAAGGAAAMWVSGTTYALNDVRRSPINGLGYRRVVAGAGTTDPSADATNWSLAAAPAPTMMVVSGTTQAAVAFGHYVLVNALQTTVTLPAAPLTGDIIWITVANDRIDNLVARNTKNIMSLPEDMTLDTAYLTLRLRYVDVTRGWRVF